MQGIVKWIAAVQAELVPKLSADKRFLNCGKLFSCFQEKVSAWRKNGDLKQVIDFGNELAAASCLLEPMATDARLEYEPAMIGTDKKIDFRRKTAAGTEWFEVKTVAPLWTDDEPGWERFLKLALDFPEKAELIVNKKWCGSAVSGQAIKARWSFINYTVNTEERAALIPRDQQGPLRLILCSNGFDWHDDELEDFADFYQTGKPRTDDWMANATARYMAERNIVFARSLVGFCYLDLQLEKVFPDIFRRDVRGLGTL
jgi:hypothetical protein